MPDRVVFDCNVFVQALISPTGPSAACVGAGLSQQITVYSTEYVLSEVRRVAARPKLVQRFGLTAEKTERFIAKLLSSITLVEEVPHVFSYDRDPKDEHYIDLAIATDSELVVSRDKDLLARSVPSDPAGQNFMARFPNIAVTTPVDLLARLEAG